MQALVAFRSQIAFEMARTIKPDVIIASACHDRMVKALRSVPDVPALLTPLAGMERMCVNATLDLSWLDRQVAAVAAGRPAPLAGAAATAPAPAAAPRPPRRSPRSSAREPVPRTGRRRAPDPPRASGRS